MKEKILRLRADGKTYSEIVAQLGCSKSSISYHCGEGQKEKTRVRTEERRDANPLIGKANDFKRERTLYFKSHNFRRIDHRAASDKLFDMAQLRQHLGDNPKCSLTGEPIDLTKGDTYELDHKVPRSRGGTNELSNLSLLSAKVNRAKNDMTNEEFVALCKKVVDFSSRV